MRKLWERSHRPIPATRRSSCVLPGLLPAPPELFWERWKIALVTLLSQIIVNPDKPFDVALKQFSRSVQQAGILAEARRRRHYESPQARRKRKAATAQRRKRQRSRF